MGKAHAPKKGSWQVWPRVRAKRQYARVRSWAASKDNKLLGFAGYKAGMTHLLFTDNRPNTMSKGQSVMMPVTIIECPPLKVAGIVFYKNSPYGLVPKTCVLSPQLDKELAKKIHLPKKTKEAKSEEYPLLRLLVYTQPKLTSLGKKKPELFEVAIGGSIEDQRKFATERLGKEVALKEVLNEGQIVDIHAVTKGKGFQGPVKRFGVAIRSHKSEKTIRGPGNVGSWTGNRSWTVAHAGQRGYHQRTDYNKWVVKIGDNPEEINPKGDFVRYGKVKNTYILLKGSIPGPKKRLIRLNVPIRPNKKIPTKAPEIEVVSTRSQQ